MQVVEFCNIWLTKLDSRVQINKSDRAIMWLHSLCKPHKNPLSANTKSPGSKTLRTPESSTIALSETDPEYNLLTKVITAFRATPIRTLSEFMLWYVEYVSFCSLISPGAATLTSVQSNTLWQLAKRENESDKEVEFFSLHSTFDMHSF